MEPILLREILRGVYADVGLNLDTFTAETDLTMSGKIPEILHHAYQRLGLNPVASITAHATAAESHPIATVGDILIHLEIVAGHQSLWQPRLLWDTSYFRLWIVPAAWCLGGWVRNSVLILHCLPCVRVVIGARQGVGIEST